MAFNVASNLAKYIGNNERITVFQTITSWIRYGLRKKFYVIVTFFISILFYSIPVYTIPAINSGVAMYVSKHFGYL